MSYHDAAGRAQRYGYTRRAIIKFLGGKCKCGFTDYRALQIDHKNGGGTKETAGLSQQKYYALIYAHPEKYQILCANCNWIKRHECNEVRKSVDTLAAERAFKRLRPL